VNRMDGLEGRDSHRACFRPSEVNGASHPLHDSSSLGCSSVEEMYK
jgi:hypothetical protein